MFELGELVKRAIKYLVEGLMVALAAYAIPKKSLQLDLPPWGQNVPGTTGV